MNVAVRGFEFNDDAMFQSVSRSGSLALARPAPRRVTRR
jgi:hypothetical protein